MYTKLSAHVRNTFFRILLAGIVLILCSSAMGSPIVLAQEGGTPQPAASNTVDTLRLADGTVLVRQIVNGPPEPPAGYEEQRQAVALPKAKSPTENAIGLPGSKWVLGCSPGAAADIAGGYDRDIYPFIYKDDTIDFPEMPDMGTWEDVEGQTYIEHELVATHMGLNGRPTRGTIDNYWVSYDSTAPDPYITNGWTQHDWGEAIGDYMYTSQSAYGNPDGATSYWYNPSGNPVTWEMLQSAQVPDGTLGLKRFYEARGYAVTEAYNQLTDNVVAGGFSYAQFKAEIDAGNPVMLGLEGHAIVGIGYNAASNIVYLHDGWDYDTHEMVWGGSYAGMPLNNAKIVHLAPPPPIRGEGTYDNTDSSFVYSGNWATYNDPNPYNGSIRYSTTVGNFVSFIIEGQQFKLIYTGDTSRGTLDIFIDDVLVDNLNEYNTTLKWKSEWVSPELSSGKHLVRLVHSSGTAVDIDAVQVFSTPIPPPAPVGPGTYNDTDPAWSYSTGWNTYSGSGPYGNSMHYTSTQGNYAEITFTGSQFALTFSKYSNYGSIDVYVDDVYLDTIVATSPTLAWQSTWTSPDLGAGTYTVRFQHAGGSGTLIDIDAIEILP